MFVYLHKIVQGVGGSLLFIRLVYCFLGGIWWCCGGISVGSVPS